jgi:hypothetical protein
MMPNDGLERHIAQGLASMAGTGTPDYLDDVLRRSVRTRQRRAWLPFQRSVFPDRAPHERAGSTTGRFQHMTFLKYAAVATIAVAVGLGVAPYLSSPSPYLSAGPSPSVAASVVPSPDPALASAWVTGTITLASTCTDATMTVEKDVGLHYRGFRCEPQTWTTSDPRLTGTAVSTWNTNVYFAGGDGITVNAGTYDVRNDGGGWLCHYADALGHGMGGVTGGTSDNDETVTCLGSGGYEGLTAIIANDWTTDPVSLKGLIFPGEAPPIPDHAPG